MRACSGAFVAAAAAAAVVAAVGFAAAAAVDVAVAADVRNILRPIVVPRGDQYSCHWEEPEAEAGVAVASGDTGSLSCSS